MNKRHKRITMQEVAEIAGVSRTTASFVLNNTPNVKIAPETRQRVLETAQRLNYIADAKAVTLATGQTYTLALVLRQTGRYLSRDAFLDNYLVGLMNAVGPAGYHVLVYPIGSHMTFGQLARSQKVDGLILNGPMVDEPELPILDAENIPIVIQGACILDQIPSVDVDNTRSARLAVEHLLDLGHQRIGHITNASFTYTSARDRMFGYRQALENAGIPYQETLVCEGALNDESGRRAMHTLLNVTPPPTAVFVGSDVVALGALQAIRERELRVPEDISVVGFDDLLLVRHLLPALTTIRLPIIELGRKAGETLLKLLQKDPLDQKHIQLETKLIIRDSTAPPLN